jgi:hypothetical protein
MMTGALYLSPKLERLARGAVSILFYYIHVIRAFNVLLLRFSNLVHPTDPPPFPLQRTNLDGRASSQRSHPVRALPHLIKRLNVSKKQPLKRSLQPSWEVAQSSPALRGVLLSIPAATVYTLTSLLVSTPKDASRESLSSQVPIVMKGPCLRASNR